MQRLAQMPLIASSQDRADAERTAVTLLLLTALVELGLLSWLAFPPLMPALATRGVKDWPYLYSYPLSDLDVWLLGLSNVCQLLLLLVLAPGRRSKCTASVAAKRYKRLIGYARALNKSNVFWMGLKVTAVAIWAPDGVWPPSHLPDPGQPLFVGLAHIFCAVVVCLATTAVEVPLCVHILGVKQRQYEAATPVAATGNGVQARQGGLTEPLLRQVTVEEEGPAISTGTSSHGPETNHHTAQRLTTTVVTTTASANSAAPSPPTLTTTATITTSRPGGTAPCCTKLASATTTATAANPQNPQDSSHPSNPSNPSAGAAGRTVSELLVLSLPDLHINLTAFVCGSVAALALALVPYYTGLVIDYASIEPDESKFRSTIAALLVAAAVCAVFSGLRGGLFTLSGASISVRLRKQLFRSLVQMEMGFFDKTKTGDVSSRLSADTTSVSDQLSLNINVLMRSMTQAALVLLFMVAASWRLTIITLIIVPIVMALAAAYGQYFASISKKVRKELADANAAAEEVLSTLATVKAHAAQESADAAYAAKLSAYATLRVKEALAYSGYTFLNAFLPRTVSALVLLYGGLLVLSHKMSPGSLISFMLYQLSLSDAFEAIGEVFRALTASVGTADKVLELMKRQPEVSGGGTLVPDAFEGHLELRDVVFHYPSRPEVSVLKGLSLVINPGEVVALVGPSGGGKSSIVKLLERFYLPVEGAVLLDGRDVGVYDNKWLRRQMALVSQEPVLYARAVRRNILYGLEECDGVERVPSQEEVEEAARLANAHDFIVGLPQGYDTCCGEKGSQLSGGQKQRIAIARALIRKPRVLLLDEATSALDAHSEAVVQEALDRVMQGRTTIVIAHRLSTVQHAHKIVLVAQGRVQEVGTHQQLLSAGGAYATLVRRQLAKADSAHKAEGTQHQH